MQLLAGQIFRYFRTKQAQAGTKMTVVDLNVGGAKFTTTQDTLTREPESMLARMFDGDLPPCQRDNKGRQVHLALLTLVRLL